MAKSKSVSRDDIVVLRISLMDIKPEIWREVEVIADTTLDVLHVVIQMVMGWTNSHLHEFAVGEERFVPQTLLDESDDDSEKLESEHTLFEIVQGKEKFLYIYDMGDFWVHLVQVIDAKPPVKKGKYPRCTGGARNCPPDDCGGTPGYERLLEIIKNPGDEEYDEMIEWLGGEFDPEEFDIDEVNELLADKKSWALYLGEE